MLPRVWDLHLVPPNIAISLSFTFAKWAQTGENLEGGSMGWGSSVSLESKEGQGPRCRRPPLPTSPPYIQTGWTFQASHDKDEAAGPRVSQQAVGGGGRER